MQRNAKGFSIRLKWQQRVAPSPAALAAPCSPPRRRMSVFKPSWSSKRSRTQTPTLRSSRHFPSQAKAAARPKVRPHSPMSSPPTPRSPVPFLSKPLSPEPVRQFSRFPRLQFSSLACPLVSPVVGEVGDWECGADQAVRGGAGTVLNRTFGDFSFGLAARVRARLIISV